MVLRVDDRRDERLRREGRGERDQIVPGVGRAEREQALHGGHPFLQLLCPLRPGGIEHEGLDAGVLEDVRVVVEGAERVEWGRAARRDHVRAHREEHFRPVLREHRDAVGLREPLRAVRLHVAADLVSDLTSGQHLVVDDHARQVAVAVERGDEQVGEELRSMELVHDAV